jgi:hypothetical protein
VILPPTTARTMPDTPDDHDPTPPTRALALDDDPFDEPVPEPDAAADATERAHARGFGELIDKVMAGRTPPAVSAEDRALLEVATAIRAVTRPVELPASRARALVESALATAIERKAGGAAGASTTRGVPVIPLDRRRRARAVPWLVAGATSLVAAAAITLLVVDRAERRPAPGVASAAPLPVHQRSRPADPLIGRIDRARAGDAAARLDVLYADRLDGYRERALTTPRATRLGAQP